MNLKKTWSFIKEIFQNFISDDAFQLGASLAYYTVFSLAPIIIIVVALGGIFFGEAAIQGQVYGELRGLIGEEAAMQTERIVQNAYATGQSTFATIVSLVTLFIGATGVFIVLKNALNKIWGLKPKPQSGILNLLFNRVLSFGMVISIGFILLVSLILQGLVSILSDQISSQFSETASIMAQTINGVIGLLLTTFLFAVIFKALPDAKIRWKDVGIGALFTAILFSVGKYAISFYLGNSNIGSTFGAAGSIVIVMIWAYYSSQILLLGAEFTYVYAKRIGSNIIPNSHSVRVVMKEVEKEQMQEQ